VLLAILALVIAGGLYATGVLQIRTEELRTTSDGVELSGLLATPRFGSPPFPTVVVVHGSGPAASTTSRALRGFVAKLVPEGFAVLIHDKRGSGSSGGSLPNTGLAGTEAELRILAADVEAWVALLKRHKAIDAERIGLLGGSQAGWVMPLVAARDPELVFVVAISGPTVTLGEEDDFSKLTGDDPGRFAPGQLTEAEISSRLEAYSGPAWYDPAPSLQAMRQPSLWLFGGLDRSVPTELCRKRIASLPADVAERMDVRWYPQGDHSLRLPDGSRIDYWSDLTGWMLERVKP
tara:strand:- start:315 stop:1190 length:876 start_codon:yes stop_codon:yes gene_type:complete